MLLRGFAYWDKTILRKIKQMTPALRPRTVVFSWNIPVEVFDCFKVVPVTPKSGVSMVKNTHTVRENHITYRVANKFAKGYINGSDLFMKTEKYGSYSQVLVTKDLQ